jgi:hypothetical protein
MADTVTIEGRPYLKRNPLGVLGLMLITLGIYFLYWYWKINDELRTFEHDESISPTRSLMAMLFGWILIVPPFREEPITTGARGGGGPGGPPLRPAAVPMTR